MPSKIKEAFRFGLAQELLMKSGSRVPMNKTESFGAFVLKPVFYLLNWLSNNLRWPHVIILATLILGSIVLLMFYNIEAWRFFEIALPLPLIRFFLFLYFELNLLAAGCMAFGRFNSPKLVRDWKEGKLLITLPGDS